MKYVYVQPAKTKDFMRKQKHDLFFKLCDTYDDSVISEGVYYTTKEFERFIKSHKPERLSIYFENQEELEFLINLVYQYVKVLYIMCKHNRSYDFSILEKCNELETIQFYWNTKQELLWDIKKNTKIKNIEIMDYYNVSDFEMFRNSSLEVLNLYLCNGLSSFTSKMHIKDLSFILDIPNLKELRMDIIKDESSDYYLRLLSKCKKLEILSIPSNFFTFNQFAWLKAHLPNVKKGLNCFFDGGDFYSIIGKRTPKLLEDYTKALKYQEKYDLLVDKYKLIDNPPLDFEK